MVRRALSVHIMDTAYSLGSGILKAVDTMDWVSVVTVI
jgi:hypothetical protein